MSPGVLHQEKSMASIHKNTVFWVCWLALSLFALWVAGFAIDLPTGYTSEAGIGPDTWPKCVLVLISLLSAIMIILTMLPKSLIRIDGSFEKKTPRELIKYLLTCAALFTYYAAVQIIGIMPSSLAFFLLFAWACKAHNWKLIVPLGFALSIGLYCFFYYVAKIPLPVGPLGGMI